MTTNKLAIIGGSGLYDVEEFKERELLDLQTPWGKPSDQILKTKYNSKEVYFFFLALQKVFSKYMKLLTQKQNLLIQLQQFW